MAAGDLAGLSRVRANTDFPVLADESVRTTADLEALLQLSAADAINIKLAKTGGPSEARRLAGAARAEGLGVIFGCMLESSVGVGAAAALAADISPDLAHDLDGGLWLAEQPVHGGAVCEGPTISFPDLPGQGVTGIVDAQDRGRR